MIPRLKKKTKNMHVMILEVRIDIDLTTNVCFPRQPSF